jgi:hypothetical protein
MKKLLAGMLAVAAVALLAPALVGSSNGRGVELVATMTSKQVVTPANKAWTAPASLKDAHGSVSAKVSPDGRRLSWKLSYSNLGPTALVIADIHLGKPGQFGPFLVRLCAPCKPGQRGVKTLKAGTLATLTSGNAWATLITNTYPNGAVRGQLHTA